MPASVAIGRILFFAAVAPRASGVLFWVVALLLLVLEAFLPNGAPSEALCFPTAHKGDAPGRWMLKHLHDKLTQSRTSQLCCILLVRSRRGPAPSGQRIAKQQAPEVGSGPP